MQAKVQTFRLVPYPASELPQLSIQGTAERMGDQLSIHYSVTGEISSVLLPVRADIPTRKHDLWRATCFEFFLARPSQPRYWEFNLSPAGHWNVYCMDAYRQVNMREETSFTQCPFEFRQTDKELSLDIAVNLASLFAPNQSLQLGITTIIQTVDGRESYWALAHPGPDADFHLRESFTLEL